MKKFKTAVLVRDNMIKFMEDRGVKVSYRTLGDDEYITELKSKVVEEANELAKENKREELVFEIADVLEVLDGLKTALNITDDEVLTAKKDKAKRRGGFEKRLYTDFIEVEENSDEVNYYESQPEKYPLID
jgi:predicted house-cleaning noncanonical NTP pyrophosphatase (MazG superfamily)